MSNNDKDLLIEACEAAKERLEVLMDADEATDNDVEVYGMLVNALARVRVRQ